MTRRSTLVDMLAESAGALGDKPAFFYLRDGGARRDEITYAGLDRRARAIATMLHEEHVVGQPVLLLYPPGPDFIAAFFGCVYAGAIATPMFPPHPAQLNRSFPRLLSVVADATCRVALAPDEVVAAIHALAPQFPAIGALRWCSSTGTGDSTAPHHPAVSPSALAMLQYTSGSTSAPKGVMLTHGNLLSNMETIARAFGAGCDSRGVSWLPMYHDMGLIGSVLTTLHIGATTTLMSPLDFLKRPITWLRAISEARGTHSGGPNFGYELCVQKTTEEERASLDLSSWEVAFTGAERIRPDTLDRFVHAFGRFGFRRSSFYPCYGLAEATLIVTGGPRSTVPEVRCYDAHELEHRRAVEADEGAAAARSLVACGTALHDTAFEIVDPETMRACADGEIGEIWVFGPGIAQGYWNRSELSARVFGVTTDELGPRTFLRTGDLGFRHGGALFVTSRLKDLIIIRGKNHYPEEIEISVERSHPSVRPGCCAAFSIEQDGEEQLVIAVELARAAVSARPDVAQIRGAIRQAIAEVHELRARDIVLLKAGSLPKTSSGKIQRHVCKQSFIGGAWAHAQEE